jgi:L-alanine-DL-glutamate epimerase-like enolase superfamily enzyme
VFRISIIPFNLLFKRPAVTSRGVYTEHKVWYVVFQDEDDDAHFGVGECAPLHDLSCDYDPHYARTLSSFCKITEEKQQVDTELLRHYPSMLFGLETAMRHYQRRSWQLWNTPFGRGEEGVAINGLVWMGDCAAMMEQIQSLLARGFRCIKIKVGAEDFGRELDLLRFVRRRYSPCEVTLRVDANGNFGCADVMDRLHQLAELDIHSIEQPIPAGQWGEMAGLCASAPLPIALDEELIGINHPAEKKKLLETIRPQYIVLKPSLHGGISGCAEWIRLAEAFNTGWWITSALESNIVLNSVAQWCAALNSPLSQGLGTGTLYTNNIPMPLEIRGERLWYRPEGDFPDASPFHRQLYLFLNEWHSQSPTLRLRTSGSTGTPKEITVRKEQLLHSAKITCDFFGLKRNGRALLCLSPEYIAGKMMIVRALYAGLELYPVAPDGHPLARTDIPFDFAAMVPLQVYNSLRVEEERKRLSRIKYLIIGGGAIDEALERELQAFPNAIYSTYGMTETLSHIALRRISGAGGCARYTPLPSVRLSLTEEGRLRVDAPLVCDRPFVTNDLAELLPDGTFRIIGRTDNVINCGGVKVQAEEVERALRSCITGNFAVTSVPDPRLGEAIVLLIERPADPASVEKAVGQLLPRRWRPLFICAVDVIPQTGNGKTDRAATKRLAEKIRR